MKSKDEKELEKLYFQRQQIFQYHRDGLYTDDEFHEQKDIMDKLITEQHEKIERSKNT